MEGFLDLEARVEVVLGHISCSEVGETFRNEIGDFSVSGVIQCKHFQSILCWLVKSDSASFITECVPAI